MLLKWNRIREIRESANKAIETLRAEGQVGASLQAEITITAPSDDLTLLHSLGDDLRFVFITSAVTLQAGEALTVSVRVTDAQKCERCWHYTLDVGTDPSFPGACKRCAGNLSGRHETRQAA